MGDWGLMVWGGFRGGAGLGGGGLGGGGEWLGGYRGVGWVDDDVGHQRAVRGLWMGWGGGLGTVEVECGL